MVEVLHHARYAETELVFGYNRSPDNVVSAEETACEALRNDDVAFLRKARLPIAAQQFEVEHGEERRVGFQHRGVDRISAVGYAQAPFHETAGLLYLGIVLLHVAQHGVVAVCHGHRFAVILYSYGIYAAGLAVLAVYAELLPRVKADYYDEHQADGEAEHVDRRVCLVP